MRRDPGGQTEDFGQLWRLAWTAKGDGDRGTVVRGVPRTPILTFPHHKGEGDEIKNAEE